MQILGFNKTTLLDYPEHVASTIFTGGCNFRCPFCQNGDLVLNPGSIEGEDENKVLAYLKKHKNMLDGVCITGGEPTLQHDLYDFIARIKALGLLVKLDTNGYNPAALSKLLNDKLVDYVAMDIKNSKEKYSATAGVEVDMSQITQSVDLLMHSGISYEFRTTIIEEFHDEDDIRRIGEWIKGAKMYRLQRFIDGETCIYRGLHPISLDKAKGFVEILKSYIENVDLRGYDK